MQLPQVRSMAPEGLCGAEPPGPPGLLAVAAGADDGEVGPANPRALPKTSGKPAFCPTACSLVLSHWRASAASPMPDASSCASAVSVKMSSSSASVLGWSPRRKACSCTRPGRLSHLPGSSPASLPIPTYRPGRQGEAPGPRHIPAADSADLGGRSRPQRWPGRHAGAG